MNKAILLLLLIGGGYVLTRKKPKSNEPPIESPPKPDPQPSGSTKEANNPVIIPDTKSGGVVISPQGPVITTQALPNVNVNTPPDFLTQRKNALIKTISTSLPQSTTKAITEKIMAMSDSEVGTMENFIRAIGTRQPLSPENYTELIKVNTKYALFPATMLAQLQPRPKAV